MDKTTADTIRSVVEALSSHYPAKRLGPDAKAQWLADYVDSFDRAGFTAADVRLACAGWQDSDAKRMPSPGELLGKFRAMTGEEAKLKKLPVTVPQALHDDMVDACGEPFAISYLCYAKVENGLLIPHTTIARDRLADRPEAMAVLDKHGLVMIGGHRRAVPRDPKIAQQLEQLVAELAAKIAMRGPRHRLPYETDAQMAERLWPSHRVDRMIAAGKLAPKRGG